ncbi:hypothetical protein COY27_06625 [Candidatus Woesearchaeota archaeon CG_4_10_14_0_2_um_filter_33_13]|nr:MAG: hypothetical protein COY27_06625 [Candidatus Woesearchaeota archaeon CG_4_10_14_0_2_um_filter_33_13]
MKITKDLALVYGVLLGDGCLSKIRNHSFISITCNIHSDKAFLEKIKPFLEKLRQKPIKLYERKKYGKIEINFSDKKLFNQFLKSSFPVGKKGPNLIVPDRMLPFLKEIINGYFATDGSLVITNNNGIKYPRLEFSSISKSLLQQVQKFLKTLEITGNIYISKRYSNNWNTLYRLQINGKTNLKLFKNNIGFINPKHEIICNKIL